MFKSNRREFLKKLTVVTVGTGISAVFSGKIGSAFAKEEKKSAEKEIPLPPGEKMVVETEALPSALGFKQHVKDIDYKKYPKRKDKANANQFCDNCALYTKTNDGWGKCTMMATAGVVSAKGWCGSWSKKA